MIRLSTSFCLMAAWLFTPAASVAQETSDLARQKMNAASVPEATRDISSQYSYLTERGIPVIENPPACAEDGPDLRITVRNFHDAKGFIVADLHNDVVEDFLDGEKVVLRIRSEAISNEIFFCLPLTKPGRYAVAAYHDRNDNQVFDRGFLRIPRERFGMSSNPVFGLGAPDFEEAAFDVGVEGRDITINLMSSGDILKGNRR